MLSLPPIINGEASKMSEKTTNVFIESTATDLTKANIVLATMVAMFSEYCATPFEIEPVRVVYADGTSYVSPDVSTRKASAKVDSIKSVIGVNLVSPTCLCGPQLLWIPHSPTRLFMAPAAARHVHAARQDDDAHRVRLRHQHHHLHSPLHTQ